MDDSQRVAFVSKPMNYYNTLRLVGIEKRDKISKYTVIDRFLMSSDIIRNDDIDPVKLSDERFKDSYNSYIKLLDDGKYLDFNEMIYRLVKILQTSKDAKILLHSKINHLVVDEYQDVNRIQEELIELISEGCDNGSVCVVGDDDQCVYQWRGSDPNYIIDFEKRYSKRFRVQKIPLDTNFRSTEAIIHTGREFIKKNKMRLDKIMKTKPEQERKYEKGDIIHRHFDSQDEEFEFVCETIKKALGTHFIDKRGNPFSLSLFDIAVLVRVNEDAERLMPHLKKHNIDFVLGGGEHIFNSPEVLLAADSLAYIFGFGSININPDEDSLKKDYNLVFPEKEFPRSDSDNFLKKMKAIKKEADKIKEKGKNDYLPDGLQYFYHCILNAIGSEDFEFPESYNYNLARFSQAVSDYESVWIRLRAEEVKYFFGFIKAYAKSHYTETSHDDPALINAVKILTIHKAKGLEFPVVFVPGLVTKRKPNPAVTFIDKKLYDVDRYLGNIEDERRVFYTAITRSQKYLFMTGYKTKEGRVKEYEAHQFIRELEKKYMAGSPPEFKKEKNLLPRATNSVIYPTSISELNVYERCPWDFKLRHIFGYNAGVPVTFGYGTNIHNILNIIHKKYRTKPPSEQEIDRIFDDIFKMRYATPEISKNMEKAGKGIVKNYVKKHGEFFKEILQTEKKFELVIGEALIDGQIDLIKKVDEKGNITGIEIVDFKTEKNKTYELDHEVQLRLYALACLKSLGLKPKKATVHHLNNDIKEDVTVGENDLEKTKDIILKRVDKILQKNFPANACPKNCAGCDYEKMCNMKKYKWKL